MQMRDGVDAPSAQRQWWPGRGWGTWPDPKDLEKSGISLQRTRFFLAVATVLGSGAVVPAPGCPLVEYIFCYGVSELPDRVGGAGWQAGSDAHFTTTLTNKMVVKINGSLMEKMMFGHFYIHQNSAR